MVGLWGRNTRGRSGLRRSSAAGPVPHDGGARDVGGKRWLGRDGLEVEAVTLHGRQVFMVTKDGYFVAYCATMRDVATFVDVDSLIELIEFSAGWFDEPEC
jgi:hypothetical protein